MNTLEEVASSLNLPLLLVTHRLEDARRMADSLFRMDGDKTITVRAVD
jgi:ABC-type molybdate transport system ATPase subunit